MRPLLSVVLVPSAPMNEEMLSTAGLPATRCAERLLHPSHGWEGRCAGCLRDALDESAGPRWERSLSGW